jgi:hypothetical protein
VSLRTGDRLDSTIAPLLLSGATIVANQGPPVVIPTKITLSSGTLGVVMTGTAGAVADSDPPITVFAQNTTTGQSFSTLAGADGSFSVSLSGSTGDSISVFARDSHVFPLQSPPVFIGTLPSSSIAPVAVPITSTMTTDANFHARRLAFDGNQLVAATVGSDNNKLLVFDLAAGSPAWSQTITVPVNTRDVVVKNGVAYVAGSTFYAYDLSVNPAGRAQAADACGDAYSVTVDGTYAYTGSACGDGRIYIYDITNPKVPVLLRNQAMSSGCTYSQLIPYGNYLIGITPDGGDSGSDVMMIDRRDINSLVKVWETKITGFSGLRGSLQGTTLYVASTEGSVAVIDVSVPTLGVLKSVYRGGSSAHGIAAVGSLAFLAADTTGVVGVNATDSAKPAGAGGVATSPQAAWDVVIRGQQGIIAANDRLITFTAAIPPQVNPSKISTSFDGHSVTVQGAPGSILGAAPLTCEVRDDTSSAKVSGVVVAADGSFTATLTAVSGDAVSIVATDGSSVKSAVVQVGAVPFGASAALVPVTAAMANGDTNFRVRHIAIEGTTLASINYPTGGTDSSKLLIFNIAGSAPSLVQAITVPANLRDVAVKNGVAYVTGGALYAYDLSTNPATQLSAAVSCGDSYSVAVDGVYAYTNSGCNDGHIEIYDITNPKVPVRLRNQGTGISGIYTQIIVYGNYLIGITDSGGTSGTDVVIIDRRDINNLVKVSATSIPGIVGFRGAVSGQKLYLAGEGTNTTMAVVDLSNVASPTFVVVPTSGGSRGVAVTGNLAAFGDGSAGVTFFDVTNPSSPRLIGTQNVGGMCWDVLFAGGKLYAAAEQGIAVINGVAAPPIVDLSRITVARGTQATASGSAGAITGAATPITVQVKNTTSNVTGSSVTVAADGSFSATVAGSSGDALSLIATDAVSATNTISLGVVPFGTVVSAPTQANANDSNFRSRRIGVEGNTLVTAADNYIFDSATALVYDLSGGSPAFVQKLTTSGNARAVAVQNGVAYVVSSTALNAFDLSANPAPRVTVGQGCSNAYSIALAGTRAYVGLGNGCGDGRIAVYDLTNPKSPVLSASGVITLPGASGAAYTQLIPYGANQLVGVSTSPAHAVVIIDRTNPTSLTKVAEMSLPANLDLFKARIVGHMLYGVTGLIR